MQKPFAAVDWGTTNFRMWICGPDGKALAIRNTAQGAKSIESDAFRETLEKNLEAAGAADISRVIICGMAGARGGWVEAPYFETPAALDGLALAAVRVSGSRRDIRILPGICQRSATEPDVMRGEETKLLGAVAMGNGNGLFCIPGTHSKWVELNAGTVVRFATFMTGELFALLRKYSVLSQFAGDNGEDVADNPAFGAAALSVLERPSAFPARLFSVRAGALLDRTLTNSPAARLSGLLIGAEIAAAREMHPDQQVRLIAGAGIARAYEAVLKLAGSSIALHDPGELARCGLAMAAKHIWSSGQGREKKA